MIEHLTDKQFEDYCRQRLQVGELISVSEHLGGCEECRQQVDKVLNGDGAFLAVRSDLFENTDLSPDSPVHLALDQMEALVDHDPLVVADEAIQDHLRSCEACSIAIADLLTFRNQIAPSLDREFLPASQEPTGQTGTRQSWWTRRATSIKSLFGFSPAPAFGLALSVIFLAAVGWFFLRKSQEQKPGELAIAPPSASPVNPEVAHAASPIPAVVPTGSPVEPVSLVSQLNDGPTVVGLDPNGNLSGADHLPPSYQRLMKKALATGHIERSSQLNGLVRPQSTLMGSTDQLSGFAVLGPAGEVLMTSKPTFRWTVLPGATSYVVEVYDSNFKQVTASPKLSSPSWTTTQSLARGVVYSWQVKAVKDGEEVTSPKPPAPQSKFRVLDQSKFEELQRAKRRYASAHLTIGLLYVEAGLMKEAEAEFRALVKANPKSDIARSLLRQVQSH